MLCYLLFVCCCPRRSWHLLCRPPEGREAEVTYRHDSKWLRCGCRDKHNRPRCGSNLGPLTLQSSLHHHSHTAVGRAHHQTTATCVLLHLLVHLHDTNLLSGLSAHHLALAALASQPLKSGTLSLYLSVPVPVLIPSVVNSRPTAASRPCSPLILPLFLRLRFGFC